MFEGLLGSEDLDAELANEVIGEVRLATFRTLCRSRTASLKKVPRDLQNI